MDERHLHIITHTVPWPANYGGVIDLFYKIKTLHEAGVKIHLHCFLYDQSQQAALNEYCETIQYYKRQNDISHFSFRLPFIVNSRRNDKLITVLKKDKYPVLVEGIHCSYYLYAGQLTGRIVLLRLHNAEFEYYHYLALHEKNPVKKFYYFHESRLLKKYERQLAQSAKIAAVSEQDVQLYRRVFNANDIAHLPVFLPYTMAVGKEGKGCFCLYHGNLSINENEEAAIWLLKNVFNGLEIPFVIAGKDPSQKLSFIAHQHPHTCLVANPGDKELQDLIAKAQINVLPSLNNTGIKLKLLNALFNGRHCLVNKACVEGSGLNSICQIAEDADDFKMAISYLYNIPFFATENEQRQQVLQKLYCNHKNLEKIVAVFW
ncbi:MAG: glycosyltransferase [Ferruginibacter sp.]